MLWYNLWAIINGAIYSLIGTFFKVILYLADIEILGDSEIGQFRERVYMLLAILMFFKIAISTIQYIVNPDELSNSDKGIGAILKNAAIAIVLLVVVPEVFKFARAAQSDIAGYIPPIILGDNNTVVQNCNQNGGYGKISCQAEQMSMTVLNIFVINSQGRQKFKDIADFKARITEDCKSGSLSITNIDIMPYFIPTECSWDFKILLMTGVGILMLFVIISMGVDIAIRVFKLTILELMAPIPIVSYIDKAKGGAFEAWLKECKDVYIDLFIRLIVIYFIVYAIGILSSRFNNGLGVLFTGELANENIFMKGLILAFLIIGLLLFAKEAPKFICDILGIKGTDKLSGMFKRAGGLMGAALGTPRDSIASAVNKWKKLKSDPNFKKWDAKKKRDALKQVAGAGLRGARSSFWAGNKAAMTGKSFKETMEASRRASDRAYDLHEAQQDAHVKWYQYRKEIIKNRMGIRQDLEGINAEIKAAQESSDKAKAALDYVHNNMGAKFSQVKFDKEYLDRMAGKIEKAGLADGFVVGVNANGEEIRVKMSDMSGPNGYSINAIMSQLQATMKDEDGSVRANVLKRKQAEAAKLIEENDNRIEADVAAGRMSRADADAAKEKYKKDTETKATSDAELEASNIKSQAAGILDQLQGFADSFVVSLAGLPTDPAHAKATQDKKTEVGFVDNPAFTRIIEEAKTAIITNSSTTFGLDTAKAGRENGYIDDKGNALEARLGDWLALNKKAGQEAQTSNLSASQTKNAEAAAKQIADKYDNKKNG